MFIHSHTWSNMIMTYHWTALGSSPFCKPHWSSLGWTFPAATFHLSNSGAVPRKMRMENRKRCPWKWAWAAACSALGTTSMERSQLQYSSKEQVLELLHFGTKSHFGCPKHVSSDCYSRIAVIALRTIASPVWSKGYPETLGDILSLDVTWRQWTTMMNDDYHGRICCCQVLLQDHNRPRIHQPWVLEIHGCNTAHSPSWNPVVKPRATLLMFWCARGDPKQKQKPQEIPRTKKRLWLDIHQYPPKITWSLAHQISIPRAAGRSLAWCASWRIGSTLASAAWIALKMCPP